MQPTQELQNKNPFQESCDEEDNGSDCGIGDDVHCRLLRAQEPECRGG